MEKTRNKLIRNDWQQNAMMRHSMIPQKVLNIKLGNIEEPDELKFLDKNENSYIIFCENIIERINDIIQTKGIVQNSRFVNIGYRDEIKCFPIPVETDVLRFINYNLPVLDIYTSDGDKIK